MNEVLTYKGFVGSIESSLEDGCLCGEVLGIDALVTYEGNTLKELETDFRNAVNFYLLCQIKHQKEGAKKQMARRDFNTKQKSVAL